MKFVVTLPEDGRQIQGDIGIPGALPVGSPTRAATISRLQKMLSDPRQPAGPIRQRIANVIPGLAAQLEPELPPAAPRTADRKATPPPTIRAREIARRLAPYVAAEQLMADVVAADVNRQLEQAQKLARRIEAAIRD